MISLSPAPSSTSSSEGEATRSRPHLIEEAGNPRLFSRKQPNRHSAPIVAGLEEGQSFIGLDGCLTRIEADGTASLPQADLYTAHVGVQLETDGAATQVEHNTLGVL